MIYIIYIYIYIYAYIFIVLHYIYLYIYAVKKAENVASRLLLTVTYIMITHALRVFFHGK